ncbi:putative metal ion transporter [Neolecta irregularis DAH-3]|uniref:Putative metal ion transporter n=1 Tax=Neolecta irregularis (strain DAH-3) TaxID=1198029 RepID=A0A1U7LTF3_NEOID|nr:putative metal ion transporter [Neolecta irregularis DAH-3]|eukprot:OLL25863.1 putative metal ion transporter [Neolecta irregularis DAH-3]
MPSTNSTVQESETNDGTKENLSDPWPITRIATPPRAFTSPGPRRQSFQSSNQVYTQQLHSSTSVDSTTLLDHREQPHSLASHPGFFRYKKKTPNKPPGNSSLPGSLSSSSGEEEEEGGLDVTESSQLLPSQNRPRHSSRKRAGTVDVFNVGPSLESGQGSIAHLNSTLLSLGDYPRNDEGNFPAVDSHANGSSSPLPSNLSDTRGGSPHEILHRCSPTNLSDSLDHTVRTPRLPKTHRTQSRAAEEDVCFPAVPDETEGISWPDLEVFNEWTKHELKELNEEIRYDRKLGQRKIHEPTLIDGRYRVNGRWVNRKNEDDRPYRFTYFSDELTSTIHSQTFSELCPENSNWNELFTKGEMFWLDVNNPTDAEMKMISKAFGIHPLTTEDISMEETREKVELFRNYYFVCFRSFDQDPSSENFLEPFHSSETSHPANVRRRIRQLKDYISVSSDWISYALIDDITDGFGPLIQRIEDEVDAIDDAVLYVTQDDNMLRRIGVVRKKVMGLLRLLGSKADVIKGFSKRCNEKWDIAPRSEIGLYLGDIQGSFFKKDLEIDCRSYCYHGSKSESL